MLAAPGSRRPDGQAHAAALVGRSSPGETPVVGILIDRERAKTVLLDEATEEAKGLAVDAGWQQDIEQLSDACDSSSRTHIAMLGTALLAKATRLDVDALAVKEGAPTPGAYSARGLGHGVLVPQAPILGIHLGVTGREPLNNQPYLQVRRATLEDLLPRIHSHAQTAVRLLVALLQRLDQVATEQEARMALRAFIRVRRQRQPHYPPATATEGRMPPPELLARIERLVAGDSEGGKRAQAVVAGLMDAVGNPSLVEVGRINDPDRHFAGDVGVLRAAADRQWERVFEVRDKAVSEGDVRLFAQKLIEASLPRGALLAVARNQTRLDTAETEEWAAHHGVQLLVFFSWQDVVEQVLFWGAPDPWVAAGSAFQSIRERLIEMEASEAAVALWCGAEGGPDAPPA